MKQLLKQFWAETGTKGVVAGSILFLIIWSSAWSVQDSRLNLWPAVYAIGNLAVIFGLYALSKFLERWRTTKK